MAEICPFATLAPVLIELQITNDLLESGIRAQPGPERLPNEDGAHFQRSCSLQERQRQILVAVEIRKSSKVPQAPRITSGRILSCRANRHEYRRFVIQL